MYQQIFSIRCQDQAINQILDENAKDDWNQLIETYFSKDIIEQTKNYNDENGLQQFYKTLQPKNEQQLNKIYKDVKRILPNNNMMKNMKYRCILLILTYCLCEKLYIQHIQGYDDIGAICLNILHDASDTEEQFYENIYQAFEIYCKIIQMTYNLYTDETHFAIFGGVQLLNVNDQVKGFLDELSPYLSKKIEKMTLPLALCVCKIVRTLFTRELSFQDVCDVWDLLLMMNYIKQQEDQKQAQTITEAILAGISAIIIIEYCSSLKRSCKIEDIQLKLFQNNDIPKIQSKVLLYKLYHIFYYTNFRFTLPIYCEQDQRLSMICTNIKQLYKEESQLMLQQEIKKQKSIMHKISTFIQSKTQFMPEKQVQSQPQPSIKQKKRSGSTTQYLSLTASTTSFSSQDDYFPLIIKQMPIDKFLGDFQKIYNTQYHVAAFLHEINLMLQGSDKIVNIEKLYDCICQLSMLLDQLEKQQYDDQYDNYLIPKDSQYVIMIYTHHLQVIYEEIRSKLNQPEIIDKVIRRQSYKQNDFN